MSHARPLLLPEEAKKEIAKLMTSGFQHHSYLHEKVIIQTVLSQGKDQEELIQETAALYKDLLGESTLRSVKNGMICLITIVSRSAIEYGVDAEYSFAASDFFINYLEKLGSVESMIDLYRFILQFYAQLVSEARIVGTSDAVSRAIRYIHAHLYEPLKVQDVAASIHMNPQAFSRLFTEETGQSPSSYIEQKKMDEAKTLLYQHDMSIAQIAEVLGYCSSQQFSVRFKHRFQVSPRDWRNMQPPKTPFVIR